VAGSSAGGLMAASIALCHPDVFGNVLSQSGFVVWKPEDDPRDHWLARQVQDHPAVPVRWYLDVGTLEDTPRPDGGATMIEANRSLRDALRAKGYEVWYAEFSGGHDYLCWQGTLADGLMALLREDIATDAGAP